MQTEKVNGFTLTYKEDNESEAIKFQIAKAKIEDCLGQIGDKMLQYHCQYKLLAMYSVTKTLLMYGYIDHDKILYGLYDRASNTFFSSVSPDVILNINNDIFDNFRIRTCQYIKLSAEGKNIPKYQAFEKQVEQFVQRHPDLLDNVQRFVTKSRIHDYQELQKDLLEYGLDKLE